MVHVCGAPRGHYGHPWRVTGTKGVKQWVSEEGKPMKAPLMLSCEHPRHMGRRRNFPIGQCYIQHRKLTRREFMQAIEDWDTASLEMRPRIICPQCRAAEMAP